MDGEGRMNATAAQPSDRVAGFAPVIRMAAVESTSTAALVLSEPGQAARVGELLDRLSPTAIGRAASTAAVAGLPDAIGRKPGNAGDAEEYVLATSWQSAIYAAVAGATIVALGIEDDDPDREEIVGAVVETVARRKVTKRLKHAASGIDAKAITRCIRSGLDAGIEAAGTVLQDEETFERAARTAGPEIARIHEDPRVGVGADAVARAALDAYVAKL